MGGRHIDGARCIGACHFDCGVGPRKRGCTVIQKFGSDKRMGGGRQPPSIAKVLVIILVMAAVLFIVGRMFGS